MRTIPAALRLRRGRFLPAGLAPLAYRVTSLHTRTKFSPITFSTSLGE